MVLNGKVGVMDNTRDRPGQHLASACARARMRSDRPAPRLGGLSWPMEPWHGVPQYILKVFIHTLKVKSHRKLKCFTIIF